MLLFGEQLFPVMPRAKHGHFLLGVDDKDGESSRWKHMVLTEIKDEASKKISEFHLQL